jgi:putative ABC transport system permease protein
MTVCILILLWVRFELSFDRFHENAEELCRVINVEQKPGGEAVYSASNPIALGLVLEADYPDVLRSCRGVVQSIRLSFGEKNYVEDVLFADPSFLEMFSFVLIEGNPETALDNPNAVLLTQRAASRYFGNENSTGRVLQAETGRDMTVAGIIQDLPSNTQFKFDGIVSIQTLKDLGVNMDDWGMFAYQTYVMLSEGSSSQVVSRKLENVIRDHSPGAEETIELQPLTKIHLYAMGGGGLITYVYIFSALAFFVLLIACMNYMNLSTAMSVKRSREVSVRSTMGANRSHLIQQFLGESLLLAAFALGLSLPLVHLLLPTFNSLIGMQLHMEYSPLLIILIIAMTLVIGMLSGSYPAFVLSSWKPAQVIRGHMKSKRGGFLFRRILVVTQFSLSILLIIASVGIFRQLNYIKNRNLGYNGDNIVCMQMDADLGKKYQVFKDALLQNPNILSMTRSNATPERKQASISGYAFRWEGMEEGQKIVTLHLMGVDPDFLKTYQVEMADGRFFSDDYSSDKEESIVMNEAAVRAMGMESPVGKKMFFGEIETLDIIGIVKDFNFRTLHYEMEPLAMVIGWSLSQISMRISGADIPSTIQFIEGTLKNIIPGAAFNYEFFDARLQREYRTEKVMQSIILHITFLIIFISCLGLFGLASFAAEQRTKEIGIRKVLGASIPQIVRLLWREFTIWILIANVIAWPVAYYALNRWLQNFAYRENMDLLIFVSSAILAFLIAVFSVSFQSIKAAMANPVDALRYE